MANEKRLIDAMNTVTKISKRVSALIQCGAHSTDVYNVVLDTIAEAPTVYAAEVVHAEWLDIRFDSMWRSMLATCSHCKVRGEVRVKSNECGFAVPDSDYCPHCGAKMDGGINK